MGITKKKGQKGFTLIELLVVVAVLGVLAGVAVPAYSKFFGSGKTEANSTELSTVQASMDSMMANRQITTVVAQGSATGDFAALPTGTSTEVLYPGYLRKNPTRCTYTWDAAGAITVGTCP